MHLRLCKLESAFVVSFVAVEPTECSVFGVLVFDALLVFNALKHDLHSFMFGHTSITFY